MQVLLFSYKQGHETTGWGACPDTASKNVLAKSLLPRFMAATPHLW